MKLCLVVVNKQKREMNHAHKQGALEVNGGSFLGKNTFCWLLEI